METEQGKEICPKSIYYIELGKAISLNKSSKIICAQLFDLDS